MSVCESSSEAGFPGMTHGIPSYLTPGHYPYASYSGQASYHFGAPFPPMYGAPMHMQLPPHMTSHASAHAAAHGAAHPAAHPSYGFPLPPTARHHSTRHAAAASGPTKRLRRTGRSDRASMGHIPTPFFNGDSAVDVEIDGGDEPAGGDNAGFAGSGSGGDPLFDELSWGFPELEFKPKLDSAAVATTDVRNADLRLSLEPTAISDHAPHMTHDGAYYSEYYPHPAADYPPMASPYHGAYYQPHPSHHPLYSHHLYKQRHAEAAAMARQARVAATREALAGRIGAQPIAGRSSQSVAGRNVKLPGVAQAKATGKRKGGDRIADPKTLGGSLEFEDHFDFAAAVAANEPCAVVPSRADRAASPADLLVPSSPSVPLLPAASAETASAFPASSRHPSLSLAADRDGPCGVGIHPLPRDREDATPAVLFPPPVPRMAAAVSSPVVPSAAASIPATVDPKRRRLLRNRVSAQQAREKKKYYINGLEGREAALIAENEALEATIAALTKENAELRSRLRRRVVYQ